MKGWDLTRRQDNEEVAEYNPDFFKGPVPVIIAGLGIGVLVLGGLVAYQLSRKK